MADYEEFLSDKGRKKMWIGIVVYLFAQPLSFSLGYLGLLPLPILFIYLRQLLKTDPKR